MPPELRYPHQPFVLKESTPIPPPSRTSVHWRMGLLSLLASSASPWGQIWEGLSEPEGGEGGRSQKRRETRGQLTLKIPSFPEECRRGFPPAPPDACLPTPTPVHSHMYNVHRTHSYMFASTWSLVLGLQLESPHTSCHVAVEGHRRTEQNLTGSLISYLLLQLDSMASSRTDRSPLGYQIPEGGTLWSCLLLALGT